MRIALIRTYQPMLIDDLAHPLGIMALDAYLRERGYSEIDLYDMRLRKETPTQILDRVLPGRPDLIGLSALSIEADTIHELARLIKARAPQVITVVGGPYATGSRRSVMRNPSIDFVVAGEGEVTFTELLATLRDGGDPALVPGLLSRRGDDIVDGGNRTPIADLDSLPFPSWDRLDMAAYERFDSIERFTGLPWAAFYTSRGCPFKCTYCHDVFGKRFRARSAAKVVEEMDLLFTRYGVREFHFYDDIFNFDKARVLEICRLLQAKPWRAHLQFPGGVRADMMDGEMLRALKAAGTYRVSYAVESASARIQKSVKKNLKIEKVRLLIEETDRMGILSHGFFMLGFPGETREEVHATVNFALASKLHTAAFFLVSPFEGSPLADEYVAPAADIHGKSFNFYDNPLDLSEVPGEEIKRIQRHAYLRFYASPKRLARLVSLLPRKRVLGKFAIDFAKLVASGIKFPGGNVKPERRPASPSPQA